MSEALAKALDRYPFAESVGELTPAEIDTELARISQLQQSTLIYLKSEHDRVRKYEARGQGEGRFAIESRAQIAKLQEKLDALNAEAEPFESEFVKRGGWLRYFLVQNTGGHVHRGMNCSTCHFTTRYSWLIDLADCDEAKMVAEYGETACTVCFPDAPTLPGWASSVAEREAAAAAKAAAKCSGSGQYVPGETHYSRYVKCPVCLTTQSRTSTGLIRSHKISNRTAALNVVLDEATASGLISTEDSK